jgi:LemA protein
MNYLIGAAVFIVVVIVPPLLSFNRFVSQRTLIANSWADIDSELKRRHDLIPNLVATVKGYAAHEQQTLQAVTEARDAAANAAATVEGRTATEPAVGRTLGSLLAVAERYPDLKANTNFLALQAELTNTEDRIAAARRFYNNNVRDYNRRIESVPSNLIASAGHFTAAAYFEVDPGSRPVPDVTPPQ